MSGNPKNRDEATKILLWNYSLLCVELVVPRPLYLRRYAVTFKLDSACHSRRVPSWAPSLQLLTFFEFQLCCYRESLSLPPWPSNSQLSSHWHTISMDFLAVQGNEMNGPWLCLQKGINEHSIPSSLEIIRCWPFIASPSHTNILVFSGATAFHGAGARGHITPFW